mgnify:CR=1 FL=1
MVEKIQMTALLIFICVWGFIIFCNDAGLSAQVKALWVILWSTGLVTVIVTTIIRIWQ